MSNAPSGDRARRRRKRLLLVLLLLGAGAAFLAWRHLPPRVVVVHPRTETVVQSLAVTGSVYGDWESEVAPEVSGVLTAVLVSTGEWVHRGQALARLRDEVQWAQVSQARAAVRVAEAQLRATRAPTRPSDLAQARAEVQGAIAQAQAQYLGAIARLRELEAGGDEAQRLQALAQVRELEARAAQAQREVERAAALERSNATAQAALLQAQTALSAAAARVREAQAVVVQNELNLTRITALYRQGAAARAELESAQASADTARQQLQQAIAQREQAQAAVAEQQRLLAVTRATELQRAQTDLAAARASLAASRARLREITEPARSEIIAQQREQVAAARAALEQARGAGRARLETLIAGPREEQIAVAARQLAQARRALAVAQAQARTTVVYAPYRGVVTEILNRPGDAVGANQPVLRLARMQAPEVWLDADERNLPSIRVGQEAFVVADAYPSRSLRGRVTEIAPRADPQRGTVQVKIRLIAPPGWLRSGMTVDANIIVAPRRAHLVVPATAVRREDARAVVLVVEKRQARQRAIELGTSSAAGVVVLAGLRPRDWVIKEVTAAKPGQRIRPVVEQ